MFDARSLLEQLVRGGQPQQPSQAQSGSFGGIGDILGQLGQAMGQQGRPASAGQGGAQAGGGGLADILGQLGQAMGQQGRQAPPSDGAQPPASGGGLEDILRNMLPGGSAGGDVRQAAPTAAPSGSGGGLGDILGRIQEGLAKQSGGAGGQGGGLIDILGQVLGQATQGVREGAGRVDGATGASGHMRDAIGRATGKSPDELLNQLKDLIQNNQLGAGAIAGGLGSILLGTATGRSIAGSAVKIGALALIGGLAYKALQNYQQGRPLISGPDGDVEAAPSGSGFEADAVTQDAAQLYIRAMIAAAAADGRIDASEQQKIIGSLKQGGLDAEAEAFLAGELNNPASIADLVAAARSPAEAVQVYTAARIAIDLDTAEEHEFLSALAQGLGLDETLTGHIDAQARAAA
ncbi:MAG: tellurite resistance TerB family protein [Hyphomicrobiaceae bacterium]